MQWALYGVIVVPICDGDTRPISKIASHKNRATREKNKTKAIISRQKLNELNCRLNSEGLTASERSAATTERKTLEGQIKRAETQSTNPGPVNFCMLLERELVRLSAHKPSGEYGGYVSKVKTAEFQADGVIAGRYLSGLSDLLVSTDADFLGFSDDK